MEFDPENMADRRVARRILAIEDLLSDQERLTLARELRTENPNFKVIEDIVISK